MKNSLPWIIGGIAVGIITFFLLNMTVPTQKFNSSAECGESAYWDYCIKGMMCHTECNLCSCRQPSCHQDPMCTESTEKTTEEVLPEIPSTTQVPPAPPSF